MMRLVTWACSLAFLFVAVWLFAAPVAVAAPGRAHEGRAPNSAHEGPSAPADGPVNINTAGVKDLSGLDGIGSKLAQKIVEYREAHGAFKKPEDVRKVRGLGKALWDRNRDRIVVK